MPKIVPDLHNKILSVAEKHFQANGFEKADMHEIATDADVAVGTIYLHYHNKETLYLHVISRQWMSTFQKIEGLATSDIDPEHKLEQVLNVLAQEMVKRRSMDNLWAEIGSLHHHQAGEDHPVQGHFLGVREPISKLISKILREITEKYRVVVDDRVLDQIGSYLFVMTVDACLQTSGRLEDRVDLILKIAKVFLHAPATH